MGNSKGHTFDTSTSSVILFSYYLVKYLCFMKQFAPGSSSEVLITSADSRIRVVNGDELVHKFKGNVAFSCHAIVNYIRIIVQITTRIIFRKYKGVLLAF